MSFIMGGTGEFGAVVISPLTQENTVFRHESFADAKAAVAEIANDYVKYLADNHGLRAHYVEGQHPSSSLPAVRVISTDALPDADMLASGATCHPVYTVEVRVSVEYADGSKNDLLDRTFKAGHLVLS